MSDANGTPASEIEERLRAADAIRGRSPADARAAMAVYRELQEWIDPSTPGGAVRVVAIIVAPGALDVSFEPLLGRAAAWGLGAGVRSLAAAAASRLAQDRGQFDRAEASIRREVRSATTGPERSQGLSHLSMNWQMQGREHEAFASASAALSARGGESRDRAFAAAHLVGAAASLEEPRRVLDQAEVWRAESGSVVPGPDEAGPPSFRSVAIHEGDAHFALGDLDCARRAWAAVRPDDAIPAYTDVLRAALRVRSARLLLAERDAPGSYALVSGMSRDPTLTPRMRVDGALAVLDALVEMGPSPAISVAAIEWSDLLHDESRRLGTAIVLRMIARTLVVLDGRYVPAGVADDMVALAAATLPDRVAELVRFADDSDAPQTPEVRGPLTGFRRAAAGRLAPLLARIDASAGVAAAARARLGSLLGTQWSLCASCLSILRPGRSAVPAGHLLLRPADAPPATVTCPACA